MDTSSTLSYQILSPQAERLLDKLTDMLSEYEASRAQYEDLKKSHEELKVKHDYIRLENLLLKRALGATLLGDLRREVRLFITTAKLQSIDNVIGLPPSARRRGLYSRRRTHRSGDR